MSLRRDVDLRIALPCGAVSRFADCRDLSQIRDKPEHHGLVEWFSGLSRICDKSLTVGETTHSTATQPNAQVHVYPQCGFSPIFPSLCRRMNIGAKKGTNSKFFSG